jgi:hypothetical protein
MWHKLAVVLAPGPLVDGGGRRHPLPLLQRIGLLGVVCAPSTDSIDWFPGMEGDSDG